MSTKLKKYASSGDRNENHGEVSLRHYEDNNIDIVVSGEDSHKNDLGFSLSSQDIDKLKEKSSEPVLLARLAGKLKQSVEIIKDIPDYSVTIKIDTGIRQRSAKVNLLDYEYMILSFFK